MVRRPWNGVPIDRGQVEEWVEEMLASKDTEYMLSGDTIVVRAGDGQAYEARMVAVWEP